MEEYYLHIIETLVVIILYSVFKYITNKATTKAAQKFSKSKTRVKIIRKIIQLILVTLSLALILFIWGVDQSELLFFISSLLTVLGIAFFAQWSIISNITATLIIFFNHPAKIGDEIEIFDTDHPVIGKISDVGIFFVTVKSKDGAFVTIPSNLFIQKMVVKKQVGK